MSVMIVIKNGDGFLVASDFIQPLWNLQVKFANQNNSRIWKDINNPEVLVSNVGSIRILNLLKTKSYIDEDFEVLDQNYIANKIMIPLIKDIVEVERHDVEGGVNLPLNVLFFHKDKAFSIDGNGTTRAIEDLYLSSTNGEREFLYGSMMANEELEPRERIIRTFKAAQSYLGTAGFPIVIANSKTLEFEIIKK